MRKICLLLSLILTMIFLCACNNVSANDNTSEDQTVDEDTYGIDDILENIGQEQTVSTDIHESNSILETENISQEQTASTDIHESDSILETENLNQEPTVATGIHESSSILETENVSQQQVADTEVRESDSKIDDDFQEQPSGTSQVIEKPIEEPEGRYFYSQKEFEDYIRKDSALTAYYIPWQTIWSIGKLAGVAWPDLRTPSYAYNISDEFGNRYFVFVDYDPEYYGKNLWEIYKTKSSLDESAEPAMLREYLTLDRIDTIEIPSRAYVDDINNPNQVYHYVDGRLKVIAFKTGNFMIGIQLALAETTGDSVNSSSTVNKIPQMLTSYSELQTAIENIRGNVAQHVAKYEATE